MGRCCIIRPNSGTYPREQLATDRIGNGYRFFDTNRFALRTSSLTSFLTLPARYWLICILQAP